MIKTQKYLAYELETAKTVSGYYYAENGYWMNNDKPDLNRPVVRHYIVDLDGIHREVDETSLKPFNP